MESASQLLDIWDFELNVITGIMKDHKDLTYILHFSSFWAHIFLQFWKLLWTSSLL